MRPSALYNLKMTSDDYTDTEGNRFITTSSSLIDNIRLPYLPFSQPAQLAEYDCWHADQGVPQWLQIQLSSPAIILSFNIYNRTTNIEKPTAFTFQGSNDGTTWTDLGSFSWNNDYSGQRKECKLPFYDTPYLYFRWYITGVINYSPHAVIAKIEFTDVSTENPQIRKLDYIKNDGATQYINTGFKPNQNTRVVLKANNIGRAAYWFGAWNYAFNNGAYACCNDYNDVYSGYDGQGGGYGTYQTGNITVDMNKNVVYLNGIEHRTFSPSTFQVNYPLYIFGQDRAGTFAIRDRSYSSSSMFELTSCQIYDNGVLVRDFIPALNVDDNNKVGLFDKCSGLFYEAQGTGTFSYGAILADVKYLVKDNVGNIYTIVNHTLESLGTTTATAQLFEDYGLGMIPAWSDISSLTDPVVMSYTQEVTLDPIQAIETATPPAQVLITDDYDMTDPSILGIEDADVVASDDVLFAISTDQGATWKAHNGTMWVTLSSQNSGMDVDTFNAIDVLDWAEIYTGNSTIRVRAILPALTSYIESVIINYIN